MSKKAPYGDARPCRNTSHHHAFCSGLSMPTWLGTMSTTRPMPRARAAADNRARPSGPPNSGDTVVGSVTSYPWLDPGTAVMMGERYRWVTPRSSR